MKKENKISKIKLLKPKNKINENNSETEQLFFEDKIKTATDKKKTNKTKLKLKIFNKNKKKNVDDDMVINNRKSSRLKNRMERLRKYSSKAKPNISTKPKEISKPFILFLLLLGIVVFIVCYLIFGTYISLGFTFVYFVGMTLTQILDNTNKTDKIRKLIKSLCLIIIVATIIAVVAFIGFFTFIVIKSPEFNISKLERGETTLVYDKNNELKATLGTEKREKLTYDELPEVLIDAIVATEDSRFFQHNGFDAPRFIKASIGQVLGSGSGGASTLTMQVAKNNFTSKEVSIIRKFTDIYLSIFKIERAFTKQEIIEFYVNAPFLGSSSYGVEQASQTYFGKSAKDMNLSEAALIAGLFQAPGEYDPNVNPDEAYERRSEVLSLMVRHGYISQEEADIANSIAIEDLLKHGSYVAVSQYQVYIDYVVKEIIDKTGLDPYVYPMLIYTNMDTSKQDYVNAVFNGSAYAWPDDTVQAGVAVLESNSGKILALGGNERGKVGERLGNYATDINRQIGSTAKPLFDYAPGIEYNNWSTGKIFDDKPISYAGGLMENFDSRYRGKMTLREAIRQSINVPALEAFREVNNEQIKNFVVSLGITPEIDAYGGLHEAHSIGAFNGSNPLSMAGAYSAFSNGGNYYEPYSVNKIVLRDSNEELEFKSDKVKVMSDSTAYMITNVLEMVASDTGVRSAAGTPVALKTGTTNYDDETRAAYGYPYSSAPDGWMSGYSTNIAMAMWTGYIENQPGIYFTQSSMVVHRNALYRALAAGIYDKNSGSFTKPSSVVSVTIEKNTDPIKLPSEYTPADMKITELFKRGTEPTEISKIFILAENVSNLRLTNEGNSVTLNWNGVSQSTGADTSSLGEWGYFIYKDNNLVDFTTKTNWTYTNDNPYGTYKVVTGYRNVEYGRSSGSTVTLDANVTFEYNGTESIDLEIGDTYTELTKPITVFKDGEDVTSLANFEITIYDSSDTEVTTIDTTVEGTYTVKYYVSYLGKETLYMRTVNIKNN